MIRADRIIIIPARMGQGPATWAERLTFATLRCEFRPERPFRVPEFPGSMVRGAVASALKKMVCTAAHGECGRCELRAGCPYPSLIEPAHPGIDAFRGERQVPPPYVLRWEAAPARVPPGVPWTFEVVLIGEGGRYAGHVAAAVERAARAGFGPDRVSGTVTIHRPDGRESVAARCEEGRRPWKQAALEFLTPVRLTRDGRRVDRPGVRDLARAILRRIGALAAFHCGGPVEEDPAELLDAARWIEMRAEGVRWVDVERYSSRQRKTVPQGGIVGRFVWRGVPARWRPWLLAGEALHVGKSCSFGLGRYRLCVEA